MLFIERTTDVVTGSDNLEDLHTVSNFPVFMGCLERDPSGDLTADMSWQISRDSGLIQLKNLLPLDVLYQSQNTTGAIGVTWMAHHKEFANFIWGYSPTGVLELGGAHGVLSVEYLSLNTIPWTILEPNPAPVDGCGANFIKGYFDNQFRFHGSFDTVIHSHVFEHMYEPSEFISHLGGFLKDGQHMIFSVPDLKAWLKRNFTNAINFEHTVFLTEPYIEFLLAKYGFGVVEKKYVMDGHSIFYATVRDATVRPIPLGADLYEENLKIYQDFVSYHEELINDLNWMMSQSTQPIYLFGAHVFAQHLIVMGLNTSKIVCLIDNDTNKQGRRLYGTKLNVASPKVLAEVKDPIVILKAGVYNDEIREDILNNINKNTIFFE
jgi:hypothetical protein